MGITDLCRCVGVGVKTFKWRIPIRPRFSIGFPSRVAYAKRRKTRLLGHVFAMPLGCTLSAQKKGELP